MLSSFRFGSAVALLVVCAAALGCQAAVPAASASETTPAPGASAKQHKFGLAMNNGYDVAQTLATIGTFFEWPQPTIAATTALAEIDVGVVGPGPNPIPVGQVTIAPTAAMTNTDNSNYTTITVSKRTAGGSATPIATMTTQTVGGGGSGSWVAWTPMNMTLASGAFVTPGDVITLKAVLTGTGNANPTGTFYISGFVKSF